MQTRYTTTLVAILLVMVPFVVNTDVSAASEFQVQDPHTKVSGTMTITYNYHKNFILVTHRFTGEDLKRAYGTDSIMAQWKMPVPPDYPLGEDVEISYQTTLYILRDDDPAALGLLASYPYPQWTYTRYWDHMQEEFVYIKRDPTNVAWEDTTLSTVVDAFEDYDWESGALGEPQWVYENGWNDCDEQLEDGYCWGTRHHCRLFVLSNGDIVGNTHYEYWDLSKLDHVTTSYEQSEDHVADEFDNPDWDVYEDSVWMDNYVNPPKFNNGRITIIYG